MCFGSDDNDTSTTTVINTVPEWVNQGGEEIFEAAKPLADRDYPVYDQERIAGFTGDQESAFDLTRNNVGAWQPALQCLTSAPMGQIEVIA